MSAEERRRGMEEFTNAVMELKQQMASYHADLRVFITEYQTEYKAMCSRQNTITAEVTKIDEAIRDSGERIIKLEQQMKLLIGIVSIIGTILIGFGANSLLGHLFP